MNSNNCKEIVFIDCMCNDGIYEDVDGNTVEGTPIRVTKIISNAMKKYPSKKAYLYFNDKSSNKIDELKKHLMPEMDNFYIKLSSKEETTCLRN